MNDQLLRPKDVGRLIVAAAIAAGAAVGLDLLCDNAAAAITGAVLLSLFLLAQRPFARLRWRVHRALFPRRFRIHPGYFRN